MVAGRCKSLVMLREMRKDKILFTISGFPLHVKFFDRCISSELLLFSFTCFPDLFKQQENKQIKISVVQFHFHFLISLIYLRPFAKFPSFVRLLISLIRAICLFP